MIHFRHVDTHDIHDEIWYRNIHTTTGYFNSFYPATDGVWSVHGLNRAMACDTIFESMRKLQQLMVKE